MRIQSRKRIYCHGKTPQVRSMLESALDPDETLICHFSEPGDCLEKLSTKACDVLIIDLENHDAEGLGLLTEARRMAPWIPTIVFVERTAVSTAVKAVRAGACECLEKPVQVDRLREAVEGQLARMAPLPRSRRALTHMEIQILQLILAGRTSQDMAAHLHRSKRTIDVHRKNIVRKLQACSLVDLIKRALAMGLTGECDCDEDPPEKDRDGK